MCSIRLNNLQLCFNLVPGKSKNLTNQSINQIDIGIDQNPVKYNFHIFRIFVSEVCGHRYETIMQFWSIYNCFKTK